MHTRNGFSQAARASSIFAPIELEIPWRDFAFYPVIKEIARRGDTGSRKSFFPFFPDERIGIFARRHFGDTHDQIVLQKCVERSLGRFLSGRVGVEAKHDFTDETF